MSRNIFEILNIPEDSSKDFVKKKYYEMIIKIHPDKTEDIHSNAMTAELNVAYNLFEKSFKNKSKTTSQNGFQNAQKSPNESNNEQTSREENEKDKKKKNSEKPRIIKALLKLTSKISSKKSDKEFDNLPKDMPTCFQQNEENVQDFDDNLFEIEEVVEEVYPIEVSLEEIFKGTIKKFKICYGENSSNVSIEIEPGTKSKTSKPFWYDENLSETSPPDIIFEIIEKPHEIFTRKDNDLYYATTLPYKECCDYLEIPTIDDSKTIENLSIISNKSSIKYEGYGLPYLNEPNKRGDLIVEFENIKLSYGHDGCNSEIFENQFLKINNSKLSQNISENHSIKVSLEDVLKGTTKIVKQNIPIVDDKNKENILMKNVIFEIPIPKGCRNGTKILMKRCKSLDDSKTIYVHTIFIVEEELHLFFKRKNNNIYCETLVSKEDCNEILLIPTIDNKNIRIDNPEIIYDGSIRRIPEYGLPYPDNPNKRGDYIVKFLLKPYIEESTKRKSSMFKMETSNDNNSIEKRILYVSIEESLKGCIKYEVIETIQNDKNDNEVLKKETFGIKIRANCKTGDIYRFDEQYSIKTTKKIIFLIQEIFPEF